MPRRDFIHDIVKEALIKDGWSITHDPLLIAYGVRKVYADLGAERQLVAAEKADEKIAVEIKSFVGLSRMNDLENAIGQYVVYRTYLAQSEPYRQLFLALDADVYDELFSDVSGTILLEVNGIKMVVVDIEKEEIVEWIK